MSDYLFIRSQKLKYRLELGKVLVRKLTLTQNSAG